MPDHPDRAGHDSGRPAREAPLRVALFNVKYSPNLGDGIIAECFESSLAAQLGHATVESIDLAGREAFAAPSKSGLRQAQLALLQRLPTRVSDALVEIVLGRKLRTGLGPAWRKALATVDLAVFGGGQLIQDVDLNFPMKIAMAADECRKQRIPMAIFAVGVAKSRSTRGRAYLAPLLASPDLVHLAVRDTQSIANLRSFGTRPALLCRDPGLLAARLWPAPLHPARERPLIGVGITHPVVLNHHSHGRQRTEMQGSIELYGGIVDRLIAGGYDVVCFSNGAGEDEAFILAASERLRSKHAADRVSIASRPGTPQGLAELIAGCDGIISHRLHANIVAYSYGLPSIGLRWDSKVDAFFDSVGRRAFMFDFEPVALEAIEPLMSLALRQGVDGNTHRKVLDETDDGIARLAGELKLAAKRQPVPSSLPGSSSLVSPLAQAGRA